MGTFAIIYTLLGGLGIFFFGMKLMSDGLQALAEDVIRKVINSITTSRLMTVAVGLIVTCIIQSSSITTVMTVGLVNAGLMSLTQAIGVIFGANIGTTITGWIIAIKVGEYALLLIGIGFIPALFAKSTKWIHSGRSILGIGLVFLGMNIMSSAFIPLRDNVSFLSSISYFGGDHYGAYIASIFMGCLLTMIVQSSTAMLGITMALATTGIINFHTAVALVLGENIGTTITAILASVGANVNAKRTARAHALVKLFGVFATLLILPYYFDIIEWIIPQVADFANEDGSKPYIAAHIAMAHTAFNVMATISFFPFVNFLANFITKITPDNAKERETPHLLMLGNPQDMLPATSLYQAESEMKKMSDIVGRMFNLTKEYWQDETNDPKKLAKILDYERITDNIHKEATVFLCYVMERPLTRLQSQQTQALIKISDELESVADYIERLAEYKDRFKNGETLEGDSKKEFFDFLEEVWRFYQLAVTALVDKTQVNIDKIQTKSDELQIWADSIRDKHLSRISKGVYKPLTALTFSDMVVALRKIRTHSFHMVTGVHSLNAHVE